MNQTFRYTTFEIIAPELQIGLPILEIANDVVAFSKLSQQFGFSIEYTANPSYYYPDFVVKTENHKMWLVETKGQESIEVAFKARAAQLCCENAAR